MFLTLKVAVPLAYDFVTPYRNNQRDVAPIFISLTVSLFLEFWKSPLLAFLQMISLLSYC